LDKRVVNYIDSIKPEFKRNYIVLFEFIKEYTPQVQIEWKFNCPFFTYYGLLIYIGMDKKSKKVYLGFCNGPLLNDFFKILDNSTTTTVYKWFFDDDDSFIKNKDFLKILIDESMTINKQKKTNQ
jgi:hypothetical protein